jgi:hypothetical protein
MPPPYAIRTAADNAVCRVSRNGRLEFELS